MKYKLSLPNQKGEIESQQLMKKVEFGKYWMRSRSRDVEAGLFLSRRARRHIRMMAKNTPKIRFSFLSSYDYN